MSTSVIHFALTSQINLLIKLAAVYKSEVSHKSLRNLFGALQSAFFSFGIIVASLLGYLSDWRHMCYGLVAVPVLMSSAMAFQPETPYWLTQKGRDEEAR